MQMRAHLLVVDGDRSIRSLLRDYLEGHGFDISEAANGAQAREQWRLRAPDAVLLDIGLPGEDALELARELREHEDVGLIIVTPSDGVVDRIVGLELGADDCIAKPFDLRELLARLRSVLRRLHGRTAAPAEHSGAAPVLNGGLLQRQRFGRCEVDLDAHRMFEIGGSEVTLTAMEFELVATFLANPNRVLTRDQLLLKTRHRERDPFDRSIDIRIGRLRRKVEPDPAGDPRCIRTVRSAGYMFVPIK
jgi:two-component system phosphate regulon response regulator OmpR